MKTIKNTITSLVLFTTLLGVSCKKDVVNPDGELPGSANKISISELANYYIVSELKTGGTKLALIYFTKEGSSIKANLHLKGVLRTAEAKLIDSKFSFDYNNDGQGVFTYELEKNATNGTIKLKSYQYVNQTNAAQGLSYAVLAAKESSPPVFNSSFKVGDLLFKVNNTNTLEWDIKLRQTGVNVINGQPFPILGTAPEFTLPIYSLFNLGFKSNDDEFIALAVPSWKNSTTPVLLVERTGTVVMPSVRQ